MEKLLKRLWIVLLAIMVFSCSEVTEQQNQDIQAQYAENFINVNQISTVAKSLNFSNNAMDSKTASTEKVITTTTKSIESINKVPDENGNVVYYIVNYKEKGFVILSADNRANPILAYSDNGKFSLNEKAYPNGLVEWLVNRKDYIVNIRKNNNSKSSTSNISGNLSVASNKQLLNITKPSNQVLRAPDDSNNCKNEYEQVGPLLQTIWGQGTTYNDLIPLTGCTNYNNGHAPTGCVATAMAQVMKYYQYPKTYNWGLMPINYGTSETQKLMVDIGKSINMNYSCDVSGASMEKVAPSLTNTFKYSTAALANYDYQTVQQEIRAKRPVILSGGRKAGWWIFATYKDGHAWVCDGFRSSKICMTDDNGKYTGAVSFLYLNMNWGWNGSLNGYFGFDNWNPSTYTFNYERKMIYNIKP